MCTSIVKRLLVSSAVVGALVASAPVARAEEVPPAAQPGIVAPRLKNDPGAVYPEQARQEHYLQTVVVNLILEVDASGAVRHATVVAPQGHGFDDAAISAAATLEFEPALRDGAPVAAKIRFDYVFKPLAPRLAGRVLRQSNEQPQASAQIVVVDASGASHSSLTAADGTWSLPDLPPGPVHLTATAFDQKPLGADAELVPGEETFVTLRLVSLHPVVAPREPGSELAEDVTVRGDRPPREVTRRTLGKEEIEHIPGTNGDALRSLQNLPGVARPPPFRGALVVRGSAPNDSRIFIDGTDIPLVYHFGGLASVVPSEVLDKIDFYPGNFSAAYGRGMGGIVDVGIRKPKTDGLHAVGQVDFIDVRALAEGPLSTSGWSFLAAVRRSWFDVWLGPILKSTNAGTSTAPRYYDYQAELHKDLNAHSTFRLLFLGSDDNLQILNSKPSASDPTFGGDVGFHTSFWRIQAKYDNKLSAATEFRSMLSYGLDSIDVGLGSRMINVTSRPINGRMELSQKVLTSVTANFGLDVLYEPFDVNLQLPPRTRPGAPSGGPGELLIHSQDSSRSFTPAAYSELELTPWKGARIVPGLRLDYDSVTSKWDLSPRINGRQDLTTGFPRTTLKGGVGLFCQPPGLVDTDPKFGQVGLTSNRSIHYDVGVEQELTRKIDLSVDAYYKNYSHLVVNGAGNSGVGYAEGLEWLLRYKPDEHFFGWVAYTLSRSERQDLPTQPFRLFQYDQTHILTVLGSYKFGRGWQVGGRFRLVSGNLYTPSTRGAFDATVGSQLPVATFPPYGARLGFFHQLDVRVDKTWNFSSWKLSAYLDIQNVYNAQNPEGVSYNYNYTQSSNVTGLPILPSLGMRAEF